MSDATAPTVIVARAPAQLIVTDGPMAFAPIEGTALEYVVNTNADVFREPTDQELYVLIAGQWFRSWKLAGPWQAVPTRELPADFARIPDGSPKAGVKASILSGRSRYRRCPSDPPRAQGGQGHHQSNDSARRGDRTTRAGAPAPRRIITGF